MVSLITYQKTHHIGQKADTKNMPKKTLYIITATVLIPILLVGIWFVYSASRGGTPLSDIKKVITGISPFGDGDPFGVKKVLDTVRNIGGGTDSASTTIATAISENTEQLMFNLSSERSSGIGFADVLVPRTREVQKKITIDDPRVQPGGAPRKIQTYATTTEVFYATTTRIRYVEQGSGHIYEHDYASSTTRKITNTTIPKTGEAYFLDNGSKVLLRYLDASNKQVENYLATIPNSSVADTLTGIFLSNSISAISVSPATNEFFYIAKTNTGSVGNIYTVKTNTERRVFTSAFSEWLPEWSATGIYLTTRASSGIPGFTYLQNLQKQTLTRILGNRPGLTTLISPDGSKVLVGEGASLSILDTTSGESTPVVGLYTLPEKCLWARSDEIICFGSETPLNQNMPDAWYKGLFFFNDFLYSISVNDASVLKVATMGELYTKDVTIDATKLGLSKDGRTLVFLNKIDMTPWYIKLGTLYNYIQPGE